MIIKHCEKEDMCCHYVCVLCVYFTMYVCFLNISLYMCVCVYFTIYVQFVYISPYMCVLCIFYYVCQGSHTSGKSRQVYFKCSRPGNALENRENGKKREKPLKFIYCRSLDNIELLPFDHCSFVFLQLQTSKFCGVSFV